MQKHKHLANWIAKRNYPAIYCGTDSKSITFTDSQTLVDFASKSELTSVLVDGDSHFLIVNNGGAGFDVVFHGGKTALTTDWQLSYSEDSQCSQ